MKLNNIKNKSKKPVSAYAVVWSVIISLDCLLLIALYCFSLITSFKSELDINDKIMGLPNPHYGWKFDNYAKAFKSFFVDIKRTLPSGKTISDKVYLFELFRNTIAYSVGCALVITTTHFLVAYVCLRYRTFRICQIVYNIVIFCMVVPIAGSTAAEIKMARALGLYGSILGQYVMKISFLGTYFLIFYSALKSTGDEYAEAAEIDGAGPARVMLQIYLPLIKPIFLGIFLIYFIGYWGEYYTCLYYFRNTYPTLGYALNRMQNAAESASNDLGITLPVIFAACMLTALPVIVVFIIFRNKFMGNMTFGGIKG